MWVRGGKSFQYLITHATMAPEEVRMSEGTRLSILKDLGIKLRNAETHLTKIIQTSVFDDVVELGPDSVKKFSVKVEKAYHEFETISREFEFKYPGETISKERHAIKRTRLRYLFEVQNILRECRFFRGLL